MALRASTVTTFEAERTIQPIYTGGDVALDQEGRILATCLGEDALLTDLGTGEQLARIEGDGEILTSLSITPSASHLVACSRSLSMRIYALQRSEQMTSTIDAELVRTLKAHTTPVITAAIDRTGTLLATGGADGVIKVWDIRRGYVTHTFRGHAGVISALHLFEATGSATETGISAKHRKKHRRKSSSMQDEEMEDVRGDETGLTASFRLASGSEDGKIRIWDLEKRNAVSTLDSHVSVVRGLCFSSAENVLVSASRDKTAILWDARSWKVRKVIPVLEGVETVGFLKDGAYIYTGGETGKLRIWQTDSGREVTQGQDAGDEGDGIVHTLYHPNLDFLLCVDGYHNLVLHDLFPLSDVTPDTTIESLPVLRRISGTHDEIIDLAYVTPERSLLALATNSEDIRLVSIATEASNIAITSGGNYFGADVALLSGHEDIIICLDVDWSGCWLATGAKDNTARLWQIDRSQNSYQCFAVFSGHAESMGAISLPSNPPPAGASAYTKPLDHPPPFLLTGSHDRTIKRWDIPRTQASKADKKPARALYTRKAHDKDINAIDTNHNSTLFASASQDRTVKIWSVEEGEVQGILRGHRRGVWSVKFAPKDTPTITGDTGPAASGNRGLILTGSGDKTVKIWTSSKSSGCPVPKPPPPPTPRSPNPTDPTPQIVSAGGDGLVKIWDAPTGEVATTLDNHTDRIWALTAHPTTSTLVSGSADSTITFWKDTTSRTLAATAAASTTRIEQEQRLQNYIHHGRYRDAITLALALNHPARLLALLTQVVSTTPPEEGSWSGVKAVDEVLASLADEQIFQLLCRLRDWNTNARTAPVAQRVLGVLVRAYPAGSW
ncbi:MAG: WD40 repeat protein [Lasallia pustulata]|uniref:WD40 repeat protein n=1 Tax=Lasallia pustulata TaxID=136370 RepID=A0A5M8PDT1_9LECA|nr:MAG: WD40 repeat protein [Lasallia pustulata]